MGWSGWISIPGGGGSDSHTITELPGGGFITNGISIHFRLRAVNGLLGSPISIHNTNPLGPPEKQRNLQAQAFDSRVSLTWRRAQNAFSHNLYQYRQSVDRGSTWSEWRDLPDVDPTGANANPAFEVLDLTNGVEYTFQVRAARENKSFPVPRLLGPASSSVSATPDAAPTMPTYFRATAGDGQIALSWVAARNRIDTYQYRLSTDGGANWGSWTDVSAALTHVAITGLTNGDRYTVQLRAINRFGDGPETEGVVATPTAQLPDPVYGVMVESGPDQAAEANEEVVFPFVVVNTGNVVDSIGVVAVNAQTGDAGDLERIRIFADRDLDGVADDNVDATRTAPLASGARAGFVVHAWMPRAAAQADRFAVTLIAVGGATAFATAAARVPVPDATRHGVTLTGGALVAADPGEAVAMVFRVTNSGTAIDSFDLEAKTSRVIRATSRRFPFLRIAMPTA